MHLRMRRRKTRLSLLLCCEGFLVLQGLIVMVAGDFHLFSRYVSGKRRWMIGFLIFACAPLAMFMGDLALGSTPPGPIDGADVLEARNRLFAAFVEWTVVLGSTGSALLLLVSAPREKPVFLPDNSQQDISSSPASDLIKGETTHES